MADEIHISTDDARAGSTPGIVRWVLLTSTVLVSIAMLIVLLIGFR